MHRSASMVNFPLYVTMLHRLTGGQMKVLPKVLLQFCHGRSSVQMEVIAVTMIRNVVNRIEAPSSMRTAMLLNPQSRPLLPVILLLIPVQGLADSR